MSQSQGLLALASEPLGARIIAALLSECTDLFQGSDANVCTLTRLEMWDRFTDFWIGFELEQRQLESRGWNVKSVKGLALNLARHLWVREGSASNLFEEQTISNVLRDQKSDLTVSELVSLLPIRHRGLRRYSFYHKEIMDYFLAAVWSQDFCISQRILLLPRVRDDPAIQKFAQSTISEPCTAQYISEQDRPSLMLLTEYVLALDQREEPKWVYDQVVSVCWQILSLSKSPGFTQVCVSSNALTILNALRFSFAGKNLDGIKAPRAFLEHAMLEGASLRKAQIRGAKLAGAALDNCNLQGADLAGTDIGVEYPTIRHLNTFYQFQCMSPDEKCIYLNTDHNGVMMWNVQTKKGKPINNFPFREITAAAMTLDKKYMLLGHTGSYNIVLWKFN